MKPVLGSSGQGDLERSAARPRAARPPAAGTGSCGLCSDEAALAERARPARPRGLATAGPTVRVGPSGATAGRGVRRPRATAAQAGEREPRRRRCARTSAARVASSGRPLKARPPMQVEVEVVDRLAAPRADVRDDPVAALGDALGSGDLGGHREEPAEQRRRRPRSARRRSAMCSRGMTRTWVGARGAMSRNARRVVLGDRASTGSRRRRSGRRGSRIATVRSRHRRHQSTGFVLIRKPMVPTSPAITYEM